MRNINKIFMSIMLVGLFQNMSAQQTKTTIALTHVNIIPMDKEEILKDQTIVVESDRIIEIGSSAKVKIPKDARTIDCKQKYLIPGLVDLHVHLTNTTEMAVHLSQGVTTIFNLDGRPQHLFWRDQINKKKMLGPSIFTCGPMFYSPRSAEDAIKEVERQFQAGYDGVKIYNYISKEEYPGIIQAAKNHGMIIVGHVARKVGLEETLESGQSIAHAEEYMYTLYGDVDNPGKNIERFDESKLDSAVELTLRNKCYVIATLVTYNEIVEQVSDINRYLQREDYKYLVPFWVKLRSPENNRYLKSFGSSDVPGLMKNLDFQKKLIKRLHEAGVQVLAGTDAVSVGPVPGFALIKELKNFVSIGFTPYEALRTATIDAASFLKSDDFGVLAKGKKADFVLIDGNPLADISALDHIQGVMAHGAWLDKDALSSMLESLPAKYEKEIEHIAKNMGINEQQAVTYLDQNDPNGILSADVLDKMASTVDFDSLGLILKRVRQTQPDAIIVGEETLNNFGYSLVTKGLMDLAVKVFELNVSIYPQSSNAYDSLGEAYYHQGKIDMAAKSYQKALMIDPSYPNAEYARKIVNENQNKK
ncbi:amidohydrolase family protein [bacterium]|nr:amidohydrolase family protein [bacterium]